MVGEGMVDVDKWTCGRALILLTTQSADGRKNPSLLLKRQKDRILISGQGVKVVEDGVGFLHVLLPI